MTTVSSHRIEVLENGPDAGLGERLVEFWVSRGVLEEAPARERLSQVVCVVLGPDDQVAGVSSADTRMAPVVGRAFWMYRRSLQPTVPLEVEQALLEATFDELGRRFAETGGGPLGVCMLLSDRAAIERDRDAVWENGFVYAGYTDAGEQVRIRYFTGAVIS